MKLPLFVALDVDQDVQALKIADQVADYVGGFKVGPRLALRYGSSLLPELAQRGTLFIDNKYHDIPSTMTAAVRASFELGASYVTVHASAGTQALSELAKLEKELSAQRPFRLLAVTVLTSFSEHSLPGNWKPQAISRHVQDLADLVLSSGLTGLVCSPHEAAELRKLYPASFLLTPGVRLAEGPQGDQARVATPRWALQHGSSALVVGRPIVEAPNPREAAKKFYDEIKAISS